MSRVDLPVTKYLSHAFGTPGYVAADTANGHSWKNTGFEYLVIKVGATTANITVKGQLDTNRRSEDITFALTATETFTSNLFPTNLFNVSAIAEVDIDADTDIFLAAVSINP